LSGYSIGVISDLERTGAGSERLKDAILKVLEGNTTEQMAAQETHAVVSVDEILADVLAMKERLLMLEFKLRKMKK